MASNGREGLPFIRQQAVFYPYRYGRQLLRARPLGRLEKMGTN